MFNKIFSLRIKTMSIRDAILMLSIFHCENSQEILKLIGLQENPIIFYQSYLELERRNMLSILAFDSYAIKSLLSDKYQEYFEPEYPLFYKNRYTSVKWDESRGNVKIYRYNNAIDVAIDNNAIRGVNLII